MAPEPGGGLFVSIPAGGGSVVVALLDPTGTPKAGWPVVLEGATYCGQLLSVEDGSVRVLCRPNDLNEELNQGTRAFAFDPAGRALAGWPIDLYGLDESARMRRDDLIILLSESLSDIIEEGQPTHAMRIVTIAADGGLEIGVREPMTLGWPGEYWALGPNGIAYRVTGVGGFDEGTAEASRISALEPSGMLPGWPASFDGLASGPAVGPDGRVLVTTGSLGRDTSRVLAFDPETGRRTDRSAELPTSFAEFGDTGGCSLGNPQPPLVAQDGTAFLLSWATDDVFALDRSLNVMAGWPYRPATPFLRRDARYIREDAYCPSLSSPAVGPDNVLYLPLYPRDATVGGSLVAVGPDGRMRAGWPVELRQPGSEFWSVVVGADGMVYALAVELESSRTSSATILAIAPDSTVLYATTILDP